MDTTGTLAVNNAVNAGLGIFQQAGVPLLYLFLILFIALFGIGVFWRAIVGGVRRVGRAVNVRI